ncbi:MAG: DUF4058 family protein [Leptolyngbyaceae cyanobacterium]
MEIPEVATSKVVTVIELPSPTNQHPGAGRSPFQRLNFRVSAAFV